MSEKMPHEQAVDAIRAKGDTMDNNPSLRSSPFRGGTIAGGALLGVPLGMLYLPDPLAAETITYVAYAPAVVASAMTFDAAKSYIGGKRVEKRQEAIRNELGEPVDVHRVKTDEGNELLLRWYGYDAARESDTPALRLTPDQLERAHTIIDFATKYKIDRIAVSALPFKRQLASNEAPTDATTHISDVKGLRYAEIHDYGSDSQVLDVSVERFAELISRYEHEQDELLIKALIDSFGRENLLRAYERLENADNKQAARKKLRSEVRKLLEHYGGDVEVAATRTELGTYVRQKLHTSLVVGAGNRAQQYGTSYDSEAGRDRYELVQNVPLVRTVRHASSQSLIGEMQDKSKSLTAMPLTERLVATYLLLDDRPQPIIQHNNPSAETDALGVATLLERVTQDDPSAVQHYKRFYERVAVYAGTRIAAFAGGIALGLGYSAASDAAYEADYRGFEAYVQAQHPDATEEELDDLMFRFGGQTEADRLYDEYVEQDGLNGDIRRGITDLHLEAIYGDAAVRDGVLKALIDVVGLEDLASLSQTRMAEISEEWRQKLNLEMPPNGYGNLAGVSSVGDSPDNGNKIIFEVTPLTGNSTEGYWSQAVQQTVAVDDDGGAPLSGAAVNLYPSTNNRYGHIELPNKEADILALDPEFMVETQYVGIHGTSSNAEIPLAVYQGTTIVGARIVDAADSDKAVYVDVRQTAAGAYEFFTSQGHPAIDLRMAQPRLQYWLKTTDQSSKHYDSVYAEQPLQITNHNDVAVSEAALSQMAAVIRTNLGLAADASSIDVLNAIHERKLYSYEPFDYEDASFDLTSLSADQRIVEVANILSQLETLNCNMAAMTLLLANQDEQLNSVTGYFDDGDGLLTQGESHAWAVDDVGTIWDATPSRFAPGVEPRTAIDPTPQINETVGPNAIGRVLQERGAQALLGVAIGYALWRQRERLKRMSDQARDTVVFAVPGMQQSVDRLMHERYAQPGSTYRHESVVKSKNDARRVLLKSLPSNDSLLPAPAGKRDFIRRVLLRANRAAIQRRLHDGQ